ncbi:hypothetical protein [Methanococcoides burtonii]|uniref:Polysaccharide deacetylase n=1 Tax=Methanococcoides burtonii (strain DSM 6242 / NBRC 107633 / OCM 468 / ACE-M) TaxID=259564 RepID=Q12XZ3_METBU|nr:hypothetical protein [Methanococcoides burtonii]ABE51683.1 Hypothetical protein Mbur_0718 [Methanococcoides burtonii DSM 6242]
MIRDFTLSKYRELLETIVDTEYEPIAVIDHFNSGRVDNKCIILRHDVDRVVQRSLDMARLENEYGIRSTYYFRHTPDVFKPEFMHKIADLGHEVGFHYEVMDKAKGDTSAAIRIFEDELRELREIEPILTACMHGNPLASWSNRDLWEDHDIKDFGIVAEPYLSIDYSKVLYLTDTGRTWADQKIRVKDVLDDVANTLSYSGGSIATTDDVIDLVRKEEIPQMCILAHPNRWCDGSIGWTKELLMQNLKNVGKAGIVWYRGRKPEV